MALFQVQWEITVSRQMKFSEFGKSDIHITHIKTILAIPLVLLLDPPYYLNASYHSLTARVRADMRSSLEPHPLGP